MASSASANLKSHGVGYLCLRDEIAVTVGQWAWLDVLARPHFRDDTWRIAGLIDVKHPADVVNNGFETHRIAIHFQYLTALPYDVSQFNKVALCSCLV